MPRWLIRAALWGPVLLVVLVIGTYVAIHRPFAVDSTDLKPVPLSQADPTLDSVGALKYLGGIDIPRMGQNIGGLSGLRWDAESGRLLAITDDARWVWMTPIEDNDRLTGIADFEVGDLLGLEGERLTGKEQGDSESLTRSKDGGWLIGFERDHRVWRYSDLDELPQPMPIDPLSLFGELEDNGGLEALSGDEDDFLLCAEFSAGVHDANCQRIARGEDPEDVFVVPFGPLFELGAVPTDADRASDGTDYVLLRHYDPVSGNAIGIVAVKPGIDNRSVMILQPPLSVDNFEGLAVREEGEDARTFLYIVSDDNFSSNQRTLLMKFEVVPLAPLVTQ